MKNECLMTLPSFLFWDVDMESIDKKKNARFIIRRVIQRGSLQDWIKIKDFYGLNFIRSEILLMRELDSKTLCFFSTYFEIPKKNFRCFSIQQSIPKHFAY